MPGGGKSTVGRHLARRLGTGFVDCDAVIERRLGCSVRQFFEQQGEARFREVEAEVLEELSRQGAGVLATGGGAVLRDENRRVLRERTFCVYLRSSPEELWRRLRRDTRRPLLQVADPLARLRELHATRDPLYRETAAFVVETGRPGVAMLANLIATQLELAGFAPAPAA